MVNELFGREREPLMMSEGSIYNLLTKRSLTTTPGSEQAHNGQSSDVFETVADECVEC